MVVAGGALLIAAAVASALLSAKHIWSLELAGCGPHDDCEWVLHSRWGSLAGWPVAFLGLAYFCGLLSLWMTTAWEGFGRVLRNVARLGAAGSGGFLVIMLLEGRYCFWCVAVQAANLGWWSVVECAGWRARPVRAFPGLAHGLALCVFVLVAVTARLFEYGQQLRVQEAEHRAAWESIARIGLPEKPTEQEVSTDAADADDAQRATSSLAEPGVFAGRYRLGPADAAVRIVAIQSYRCRLCQQVEEALGDLLSERSDVSLSIKHFPMDANCNRYMYGRSPQPKACMGARAAESIGRLGGADAFWHIHRWLFERGGLFSSQQIEGEVRALGLDVQQFRELYHSQEIAELIAADIDDGVEVGLGFTPMIFVNGYELEGWRSAGALSAAVQRAASLHTAARPGDRPAPAIDAQFRGWQEQGESITLRHDEHVRGPEDAAVTVVVFADYCCPFHRAANELLQQAIRGRDDVRYVFRHFPIDDTCNERVEVEGNAGACEAARVVEAANLLAGPQGYWRVHDWLLANPGRFDPRKLGPLAREWGLDSDALQAVMCDEAVEKRIRADLALARELDVTRSPTIYVNGKWVQIWRTPGLLERIIASAAEERRPQ